MRAPFFLAGQGHLILAALLPFLAGTRAQDPPATTCTPSPYEGLCQRYGVTYPIALSEAAAQEVEQRFTDSDFQRALFGLQLRDYDCGTMLQSLVCADLFPRCTAAAGSVGTPEPVCRSSCAATRQRCEPVFQRLNVTLPLPNCDSSVDQLYGRTKPYVGDNVQCTRADANLAALPRECLPPFVPNPAFLPNTTAKEPNLCNGPCCAPCPVEELLFPPGEFNMQVRTHQIVHLVSFIAALYVVVSYSLLPGRREHPADIVLHFGIAVVIWMSVSLWTLPDLKRMQCADAVTQSTASNNWLCAAQSVWLMYGVNATVLWAAFMIWNLHLTIVHKSNLLGKYKLVGIVICWGVPVIQTAIPVLMNDITSSTGATCFPSRDGALKYMFGFHGVVILPAFIANISTFVHIARIAARSSTNGSTNRTFDDDEYEMNSLRSQTRPRISRRRQLLEMARLNWRALLLGTVFVVVYITYLVMFLLLTEITENIEPATTPWVGEFLLCLISNTLQIGSTNAQAVCAGRFSSFLPSSALIIAAHVVTGLVGVWYFVIFGTQRALLRDWGMRFTKHRNGSSDSLPVIQDSKWGSRQRQQCRHDK
ncbi:hypothetical protein BC832DRAFT_120765 [Gaertneriomyces semiglobifer]|nr:hypothetical protein BC832DRAFT_120765 [Gaertneriomyces semiglobifer]